MRAGNVRKGRPAHEISPVALEAVKRIDALFNIERGINGLSADARLEARQRLARPLVEVLRDWLLAVRARMSKHAPVAKAINYMFEKGRWTDFTRFLDDGRICLTNNSAERALRGSRDEAFIVPLFFKCLETWRVGSRDRADTALLSGS